LTNDQWVSSRSNGLQ